MDNIKHQLQKALDEIRRLRQENQQLKDALRLRDSYLINGAITASSKSQSREKIIKDRITLFRKLYKALGYIIEESKTNSKIKTQQMRLF